MRFLVYLGLCRYTWQHPDFTGDGSEGSPGQAARGNRLKWSTIGPQIPADMKPDAYIAYERQGSARSCGTLSKKNRLMHAGRFLVMLHLRAQIWVRSGTRIARAGARMEGELSCLEGWSAKICRRSSCILNVRSRGVRVLLCDGEKGKKRERKEKKERVVSLISCRCQSHVEANVRSSLGSYDR